MDHQRDVLYRIVYEKMSNECDNIDQVNPGCEGEHGSSSVWR